MKKLLSFVLCFVVLFAFIGCSNNSALLDDVDSLKGEISKLQDENSLLKDEVDALKEKEQPKLPDFADCEIGYKLEVYPKVAFDYKVSEDCIVHIESITATLTAKNVINEGDLIEEAFYRNLVTITISGSINMIPSKTNLRIGFRHSPTAGGYTIFAKISSEGNFKYEETFHINENGIISFYQCYLA